jgi:DnaJ-class molecular chaperone
MRDPRVLTEEEARRICQMCKGRGEIVDARIGEPSPILVCPQCGGSGLSKPTGASTS